MRGRELKDDRGLKPGTCRGLSWVVRSTAGRPPDSSPRILLEVASCWATRLGAALSLAHADDDKEKSQGGGESSMSGRSAPDRGARQPRSQHPQSCLDVKMILLLTQRSDGNSGTLPVGRWQQRELVRFHKEGFDVPACNE